jgi:hypothetical protein
MSQRAKAAICREINQPVVVEDRQRRPAAARRGDDQARRLRRLPQRPIRPPTAPSPSRRRWCWATRAPAKSSRWARASAACRRRPRRQFLRQHVRQVPLLPDRPPATLRPGRQGRLHPARRHDALQGLAAGKPLNVFSGCGVMAEYATLHVDNVVKIDAAMPLDKAALIGCGVMTGVGAAVNTAKVEPGSIAVVFGCGGVGLNAIQGCAIAGARIIVAVDTADAKLEMAKAVRRHPHAQREAEENIVKALKKLTERRRRLRLRVRRPRRDRGAGLRLPAQGRHGGGRRRRRRRRTPRPYAPRA